MKSVNAGSFAIYSPYFNSAFMKENEREREREVVLNASRRRKKYLEEVGIGWQGGGRKSTAFSSERKYSYMRKKEGKERKDSNGRNPEVAVWDPLLKRSVAKGFAPLWCWVAIKGLSCNGRVGNSQGSFAHPHCPGPFLKTRRGSCGWGGGAENSLSLLHFADQ